MLEINALLTLIHSLEEAYGKIWRYLGNIVGVRINDIVGISIFTIGLTVLLWVVGIHALVYYDMLYLGILIGARLSDSWYSHIELWVQGYRPNPGIYSIPLYIAEVVVLLLMYSSLIAHYPIRFMIGMAVGWTMFLLVIPTISAFKG
jgi:hypothetical protein